MKDVIEMAREVKMPYDFVTGEPINLEKLKAFAELVRADQREIDAKVCADLAPDMSRTANDASIWDVATFDCAAAIRNRGNT
jgi:hypothetical protein